MCISYIYIYIILMKYNMYNISRPEAKTLEAYRPALQKQLKVLSNILTGTATRTKCAVGRFAAYHRTVMKSGVKTKERAKV